jgi:hypothetical protein
LRLIPSFKVLGDDDPASVLLVDEADLDDNHPALRV